MLGLLSILSIFRNEFNKFDNTGAQMLDSNYHMMLIVFVTVLCMEMSRFCHIYATLKWASFKNVTKSVNL